MLKFSLLLAPLIVALSACSGGSANSPTPSNPTASLPVSSASSGALKEAITIGAGASPVLHAYVADGASIKVSPVKSNGNLAPTRALGGPATGLTHIQDVAVDEQGALYVANDSGGGDSIRIFAPDASGNVAPIRVIAGTKTEINVVGAVAVDADGRIYVGERTQIPLPEFPKLLRFAPNANGNVSPVAILETSNVRHIAQDSTGKNLILSEEFIGPSVSTRHYRTFPRAFNAASLALFDIIGLGGQPIADDASTHSYHVGFPPRDIFGFDESAVGSVFIPPGPQHFEDLLLSCDLAGMAVEGTSELVTTGAAGTGCNQAAINVYDANANGPVPAIRTITGNHTTLQAPSSVAVGL